MCFHHKNKPVMHRVIPCLSPHATSAILAICIGIICYNLSSLSRVVIPSECGSVIGSDWLLRDTQSCDAFQQQTVDYLIECCRWISENNSRMTPAISWLMAEWFLLELLCFLWWCLSYLCSVLLLFVFVRLFCDCWRSERLDAVRGTIESVRKHLVVWLCT